MSRIEAVIECEHGRVERHLYGPLEVGAARCHGGSRTVLDLDALIGEVGLRLLRYVESGGTLTPERVATTMLNVFDGLGGEE